MKEQTLATTEINTLPEALRGLVEILPQATWNGYNVWANFTDADEAKSLGFALSKNGRHAGQYFTNVKLQLSLAKKRAKAAEEKKSLTPPPVAPVAKSEIPAPPAPPVMESPKEEVPHVEESPDAVESQAHLFDNRTEFYAVVEADIQGVACINLIHARNCTPSQFTKFMTEHMNNDRQTVKRVRVMEKLYKSDAAFKGAFRNMKLYKGRDFYKNVINFNYGRLKPAYKTAA